MTQAEHILEAVAELSVAGHTVFSQESIRNHLSISHVDWHAGFVNTFLAMRVNAGKSFRVSKPYKNIFEKLEHGRYELSESGYSEITTLESSVHQLKKKD